ncbi:MAG: Glu/Leu/Phe/Val dehydrogenase dimerization domain-containing protein [Acidobacteriota bacterium]
MSVQPLFTYSFDLGDGVSGHAVVDSLVNGTSSGGVRIVSALNPGEVRTLSSEMTLKYAFFGLPRGGAKCGISMPDGLAGKERLRLLEEAGQCLGPLIRHGTYYPGMDMNCGPDELRAIYRGAGIRLGELTDTSLFTAVFAASAVTACGESQAGDEERPLDVAVEGFGNVGAHLASRLDPKRYRIVAISTIAGAVFNSRGFSPSELTQARKLHGNDLVMHLPGERLEPKERLLELDVDILVPAARVGSIDESNEAGIRAACIVPVANAPCTGEALRRLQERGIMVLPGFVCNAGGVLGSSLYDRGVSAVQVDDLAKGPYRDVVRELVRTARAAGLQPTEVARKVAQARFEKARQSASEPSRALKILRRMGRRSRLLTACLNRDAARACEENLILLAGELARVRER